MAITACNYWRFACNSAVITLPSAFPFEDFITFNSDFLSIAITSAPNFPRDGDVILN